MACATFYFDIHAGFDGTTPDWGGLDQTIGRHYYPTSTGADSSIVLSATVFDTPDNPSNPRLDVSAVAATDAQIQAAAIWMGLLEDSPGSKTAATGLTTRGEVSPLTGEKGPYLNEIPESSMATDSYNGAVSPGGTYAWIVGEDGKVYGAYRVPATGALTGWYHGFSGSYP